jgi:hypothetical protein
VNRIQVENIVAIELAYINTKHPDFHREAALVSGLLKSTDGLDENSPIYRQKTPRATPSPVSTMFKVYIACFYSPLLAVREITCH